MTTSASNLTPISAYNPRTFFSASAIFRRAAEKLDISDAASEEGCQLAMIVSGMRLGTDGLEKLADNAANVYRGLYRRSSDLSFARTSCGGAARFSVLSDGRTEHQFGR